MTDLATVQRPGDPERYIVVAATDHPELDDWVTEQAQAEAAQSGAVLGEYLGREDVLGERLRPDVCCHVFAASSQERPRD